MQNINWTIEFAPLVPPIVLWVATALAVTMSALLFWLRKRGALIRTLALTCLILALANPNLRQEEWENLSNIAIAVIDESASQNLANRTQQTRALTEALKSRLKQIPNLEIRWITSGNNSEDNRDGTTLFADLNRGLAGVPADRLAGVFLITDGQIHDTPAAPEDLGINAPIHALITGRKGEVDRRIEILKAPRFGIVEGSGLVKFRIVESGTERKSNDRVEIKITHESGIEETRQVQIGETVEFRLGFRHAGQNIAQIELEKGENELTLANNKVAISAEGVRENLRVLLVSGEPHAGERTWRNLLKSDAAVDLVHFTILRPPEKQDGTPINQLSLIAFPTRELFSEKLDDFDLIIFDRYQRRGVLPIPYLGNIARYVEDGGAVLVAAGESYSSPFSLYRTPLSEVLPAVPTGRVIEASFRAALTDKGEIHPVTNALPGANRKSEKAKWGRWFRTVEADTLRGEILMKGAEEKPLLVLDRIGDGRVALLLSDHAWLWARGYDGGGPHASLLRKLAHWLMKEPDLEEEFLSAKGSAKKLTIERRSMEEKIEPVTVKSPSGQEKQVKLKKIGPGTWRSSITVDELGLYKMQSGTLSALTHVGPINSKEISQVAATDKILKPILDATSGGAFWMGQDPEQKEEVVKDLPRISVMNKARLMSGSNWIGLADRKAHLVRGVKHLPLFTGLIALAILLGIIALTWYREGH